MDLPKFTAAARKKFEDDFKIIMDELEEEVAAGNINWDTKNPLLKRMKQPGQKLLYRLDSIFTREANRKKKLPNLPIVT